MAKNRIAGLPVELYENHSDAYYQGIEDRINMRDICQNPYSRTYLGNRRDWSLGWHDANKHAGSEIPLSMAVKQDLDNLFVGVSAAQKSRDRMIAHWSFDREEGNKSTDETYNGHDAKLVGGAKVINNGWRGGALYVGGGDQHMVVPHHQALQVGKNNADFSFSFFVYLISGPSGGYRLLGRKGDFADHNERTPGLWLGPDDNKVLYTISTTAENVGTLSSDEIDLYKWTHIAYLKQGQNVILYINGEKQLERELTAQVVSFEAPLYIGNDFYHKRTNALFDEIMIFNYALSPDEITMMGRR